MSTILRLRHGLSALLLCLCVSASARAQFTEPTPAELAMTSIPQVPGAPAVYLFREETTEDALSMFSVYERIKILTERGTDFANVEIPFSRSAYGYNVDNISGRTIHADGTVIPFTGKPYEKLIANAGGAQYMAKVFSLPAVEVGSIVEYRYKLHADDYVVKAPRWAVQSKLFTMKAHYLWKPTDGMVIVHDEHNLSGHIAWVPILPNDADFKHDRTLVVGKEGGGSRLVFDLNVRNIPPAPDEDLMPPMSGSTYQVIFYYTSADSGEDYWKTEGKYWSKAKDKFIGPGSGVKAAVQKLVAPTDTPDQKLRVLYAAVMQIENNDLTRQHTTAEERAAHLREIKNADDVLERKHGSSDQITGLFIAMARAAGFKAYAMSIVNRDTGIFMRSMLSFHQLDDDIAVVELDGKEVFFDPGQRFCEYGHLAWKHTLATGIRQTEKEIAIASTPGETWASSTLKRVANLTMDEHGVIQGKIDLAFTGSPALNWRHEALRGDDTSLNKDLRENLESQVPHGLDVRVVNVDNLADFNHPLVVHYEVSGPMATSTGKRLLVPADIFRAQARPTFSSSSQRTVSVYFHYAYLSQDAVRIRFPETLAIESIPTPEKYTFKTSGYSIRSDATANTFSVRRDFTLGAVIFDVPDYPDLHTFYTKFETKDNEPVVLVQKTTN